MSLLFYSFIVFYFSFAVSQPENCTYFEEKLSKFDKKVPRVQIICRYVPSNFIIKSFYFVEQPYPQDLIITESTIPVLSDYTSLLNMRYIRNLSLKGLGIKCIRPRAFRNMKNLDELDLSYNRLNEISSEAFVGLVNLRSLKLSANNISVDIQYALKDLAKLEYVDVSNNSLEKVHTDGLVANLKAKYIVL